MKKGFICGIAAIAFAIMLFPATSPANGHPSCSEKGGEKGKSWSGLFKKKNNYGNGKDGKNHGFKKRKALSAFWWRDSSMAERIRLEDGQIARMDEIADSYMQKLTDSYQLMFDAKSEFHKLMKDPESSDAAIKAAAAKKDEASLRNRQLKLDMVLEMRAELTPQQIQDLAFIKMKGEKWRRGCGKN